MLSAALLSLASVVIAPAAAVAKKPSAASRQPTDWLHHEQPSFEQAAANGPAAQRLLDQVWVVSCRGAGQASDSLRYSQYHGRGQWRPSDRERFIASAAPGVRTCLFVAGYGYDSAETRELGLAAYRGLTSGVSPSHGTRFVIWSWPSDQGDQGIVRELRATAAHTDRFAWQLAQWLEDTAPGQSVSLIGTSFGARIVGGALHLLGGGKLGAFELPPRTAALRPARVVLISPAIDDDWLLPDRRFGLALSQVDRMLLLNNSVDPMMKRYHWLYDRRSTAEALGRSGLCCGGLGCGGLDCEERKKIVQVDTAAVIGAKHGCGPYFQSTALLARMKPFIFDDEPPAPQIRGNSLPASFPGSK